LASLVQGFALRASWPAGPVAVSTPQGRSPPELAEAG
jgi:hypothetical protein